MRITAQILIFMMMASTLAGCTGGDPDSGGEMDTDAINDLIDQNLQDFINNTTITVNQEIHHHYYNNTSITNNDNTVEYNNTTINEGDDNNLNEWSNSSYNFNGSGDMTSVLQVLATSWEPSDYFVSNDIGQHVISLNETIQIINNNEYLMYVYVYNGTVIYFEDITCNQLINYRYWSSGEWETYLIDTYGWSDDVYQLADDIQDDFYYLYYNNEVESQCGNWNDQYSSVSTEVSVFTIEISRGEAIQFVSIPRLSAIISNCDNGINYNSNNGSIGTILGGHSNCTVSGIAEVYSGYGQWTSQYIQDNHDNNTTNNMTQYGAPSWYNGDWRYYETENTHSSVTPSHLEVYFNILYVENYN